MKNAAVFPKLVAISDTNNSCYELVKGRAMTLPQRRSTAIQCHAGMLWLTITGDAEDYFLRAGESVTCQKDRAVVVEAIHDVALFQVCDN